MRKRFIAAYTIIGLVLLSFASAYFVRPHPPTVVLVSESQELPEPKAHFVPQAGLGERVSKSYGLALVLVISEFSQKNAVALEAIRSWAHENFQHDQLFLNAPPAKPDQRGSLSIIDAFCNSLLSPPSFFLEDVTLNYLKHQISAFHQSKAYQSFRADYFETFGLDRESALMLARYQSERAQKAVSVILSVWYWLFAAMIGLVLHLRSHSEVRSTREQRAIAFFWFSLSIFYVTVSWFQNDVSVLVSSFICAVVGFYIRRPITVSFGEDKGLSFRLLVPDKRLTTIILWVTGSLVAVQILTWVHGGTLAEPDPVSLVISSLYGDFLHDPTNAKRIIMRIVGGLWLLFCMWASWAYAFGSSENLDEGLAPLKDSLQ
jgi:hypothetical protein